MGKLDELRRAAGGNVDESMGGGRSGSIPREYPPAARPAPARLMGVTRSQSAAEIPLARIVPDPDQPREEFEPEALQRLAESLRTRGQLQPIRVRWVEEVERYVIVCGERRWRAAELAGLASMSCVTMEGPASPQELLAMQLVENMLREDLRPMEQARGFRTLMDANGWTGVRLAKELGIAQASVAKTLALLDLPAEIQDRVEHGALSPSVAYEVARLSDPADQAALAARVVAEGLNRADTIAVVRQAGGKPRGRGAKAKKITSRLFRTASGYRVTVEHRRGLDGRGALKALREAVGILEREVGVEDQAAA